MINEGRNTVADSRTAINERAKTVTEVVAELKEELKEFAGTRFAILRTEMTAKLQKIRMATPMLVIGVGLLGTAWLAFTGFLVCIVAEVFWPRPWAFVVAFLIVAVGYAIVGGVAAQIAWKRLKATSLKPEVTMRVLEQDRVWMQTEVRTQL